MGLTFQVDLGKVVHSGTTHLAYVQEEWKIYRHSSFSIWGAKLQIKMDSLDANMGKDLCTHGKIFAPIILFNIDKETKNDTLVTRKS